MPNNQPPPPGGYGQSPAYSGPAPNEPSAVTAMVLGILGITVCGVLAPFAWNVGKKSVDNIRNNPGQYSGEGMAQAGYILGIIGTVLLGLALIFLLIWVVAMGAIFGAAR